VAEFVGFFLIYSLLVRVLELFCYQNLDGIYKCFSGTCVIIGISLQRHNLNIKLGLGRKVCCYQNLCSIVIIFTPFYNGCDGCF